MAFLNPLFLFGLLAAGIPLIIHLWNRRRVLTIDFSSLMFLTAAHRENARRFQLRQLLILLLRMAILTLIALALARPFLTLGLPLASMRAKTDVVLVLDNSYSMAYQDVDGVRFEKAKILTTDILDTLRSGDRAAFILMSDNPKPVFRQFTPDIESVRAAINEAAISYRTTNVQPSFELAHEILADSEQLNKELYLISDFAQNGWKNWSRIPNRSGAHISLIPVAENEAHNVSIEEIRPSNQLIGVNLLLQLNVRIANHSAAPLAENILALFIGDEKQKTVNVSFDHADKTLNTILTLNFSTPGTHVGYLTLTEDRLNIDNRRYFAFDVIGEVRVLCVGEQTEHLMLALNPNNLGSPLPVIRSGVPEDVRQHERKAGGLMIISTECTPAEFEMFPLEDYDVVILADVPKISSQIGTQLQEFIHHGKSVIIFASSQSDITSYNEVSNTWLPAELGDTLTWTPPQQIGTYQVSHPIFDIFPSGGFSTQYAPQFYNGLTLRPTPGSEVIARFNNATPFLVERIRGTSAVLLYNCGLFTQQGGVATENGTSAGTPRWTNDLFVNPYFLPMLQQSVLYTAVASSNSTWLGHVGDTYTAYYPRSAGGKASIRLIADNRQPRAVGQEQSAVADRAQPLQTPKPEDHSTVVPIDEDGKLRFQGTERPGIYEIEVQTQGRIQRDFFSVNVDANEADLAQIPLQQAASRVGAQTKATDKTEGAAATGAPYEVRRHGREIWGELLIIAVCLLMLEGFLSNREGVLAAGEKQ